MTRAAYLVGITALCFWSCHGDPRPGSESAAPAPPEGAPVATHSAPITTQFRCDGVVVTALFTPTRVVLTLPDATFALPQLTSASGARYSDGRATFWNKGREATFERADGSSTTCTEVSEGGPAATSPWTATATGVGPIRVGTTRADAERTLGRPFAGVRQGGACQMLATPDGPGGVQVMLIDELVARVDVLAAGVKTDAGVQVGDREADVRQAYGDRLVTTAHKYTAGKYLTLTPTESPHVVFETDGERVTRYRVGRLPEVDWVESCG